jgi:hypothetical protein
LKREDLKKGEFKMSEVKALKQKAKELGKKPPKELLEAAQAVDRARAIFKEAGFSPYTEYMNYKYGQGNW